MWKIKHIFDGEYGCEESDVGKQRVVVTLENETGEEQCETVSDAWLRENGLDVGSRWPDYHDFCLETKDLLLKKAVQEDWSEIYQNLWRHAESAAHMVWEVTRSEQEAMERMKRTVAFQRTHKYAFLVYEKAAGRAIGFAGMTKIAPGIYEDTGIALGPDFVGKGYGTQILDALTTEAEKSGAYKFIASCRKANIASHNLQLHCGFTFTHEEDRVDPRDGQAYVLEFSEKQLSGSDGGAQSETGDTL